ncbi:MAG: phosphoenolpyruvate--protein phosphotransferase [Bacteroidetes bacterium]|nr:phosphoenolpyruvate--protein phosphotransferase [Bacteroidota bacterium]MBU1115073.1 phosphoenolpyruvate--protein phosphotransferase [Bacteroidota bacterium]MBU1797175.1 phosphoenolpyruvate--protein phosphotransferase [Bacteroidota bacterium]
MTELKKANVYRGIPAAPGIRIAEAFLFKKDIERVVEEDILDVDKALENFNEALVKSKDELSKVFSLAVDKLGEKRAALFEAQIMILDDPILIKTIVDRIIDEKKNSEFIVNSEFLKYQNLMSMSEEPYMKERSHDIEDIKNRIIRNIRKKKWKSRITEEEIILVSNSLTPADTVLFSRLKVTGYVTNFGGLTSHAAIVARSLNVPAVVGLHEATENINNGDRLIIDGFNGIVVVNPDDEQLEFYQRKLKKLSQADIELAKLKDLPAITLDGKKIDILANLDMSEELELIIQNGGEGVGLMRTEQIFQEYDSFPSEEEQTTVYSNYAQKLYPLPLTIRAFDIGGDKVLPVDVREPNPMLGWRGIRFLLDNRSLFKSQVRAVLKASIHKNIKFMIPMVASFKEVKLTRVLFDECKNELTNEGVNFDNHMELGIMIEVPSAALMIKDLADEVDFFSIGTNDLIQYMLAVDRGNDIVSNQYQEFHPAIIRTLYFIISEAKKYETKVTLCGEMAADYIALPLLVGLGLDSISVSGSVIPHAKQIIRALNYKEISELVAVCLKYKTEKEIHDALDKFYFDKFGESSKEFYSN